MLQGQPVLNLGMVSFHWVLNFGPSTWLSTLHIQLSNLSRPSRLKVFSPPPQKWKTRKWYTLVKVGKKNTCLSHFISTANTSWSYVFTSYVCDIVWSCPPLPHPPSPSTDMVNLPGVTSLRTPTLLPGSRHLPTAPSWFRSHPPSEKFLLAVDGR